MALTKVIGSGIGTVTNQFADANMSAGSVLQSKVAMLKVTHTQTANSFADVPSLSIDITPNSSNSIMILRMYLQGGSDASPAFRFWRQVAGGSAVIPNIPATDGSRSGVHARIGRLAQDDENHFSGAVSAVVTDEPSTTSVVTYKVQARAQASTTLYINRSENYANTTDTYGSRTVCSLEVTEIAG
jgi:hypothetical protein